MHVCRSCHRLCVSESVSQSQYSVASLTGADLCASRLMPAPTRCSKRLMKAQKCCALMASAPGTTWPFPLLPSKCSSFQPHGQESTLPWPSGMTSCRYAGQACTCWLVTATVPVPNGVSQYWRHTLAVITAAASVHDTINPTHGCFSAMPTVVE